MSVVWKGSIMSAGARCAVAEMLSILGYRESGILDWADNTVGIRGVTETVMGITSKLIQDQRYDYGVDDIDDGLGVKTYPTIHGLDFIHADANTFGTLGDYSLKRAEKTKAWFNEGRPMIYIMNRDEDRNSRDWEIFERLLADKYKTENFLVIDDWKMNGEWYEIDKSDTENRQRVLDKFENIITKFYPSELIPKRSDYNPRKYREKESLYGNNVI